MKYFSWGWQAKPSMEKYHYYDNDDLPLCGNYLGVILIKGEVVKLLQRSQWLELRRK